MTNRMLSVFDSRISWIRMAQHLKISSCLCKSPAYPLSLLLLYFLFLPGSASAHSMDGFILVIVPPFVVLASTVIKFFLVAISERAVTAILILKLALSLVWESFLFFLSLLLFMEVTPLPSNTLLALLSAGWVIMFSAFSLYPNLLFFRKGAMSQRKRIQRAIMLGLIAPVITMMVFLYFVMLALLSHVSQSAT